MDYFPLKVNDLWIYRVANATGTAEKQTTVEAMEMTDAAVGDLRVRNEHLATVTLSWEYVDAGAVRRTRQQDLDANGAPTGEKAYVPSQLVFDSTPGHLTIGATWNESYMETKTGKTGGMKSSLESVTWTVEATDDHVAVPAGDYVCLRVRRHHSTTKGQPDEVAWFAEGVGRVKETGGGPQGDETKELVRFTRP